MAFGALPPGQPGNWSIFDKDGAKALDFDTFFSCSITSENKISPTPVEKGSFADYNKIASPTAVSVVLGRTGKSDELAAFLTALDKLAESTDLVSIVTPEKTFLDYNLVSYDYDRKAENGELFISTIFVNPAPMLKRLRPAPQGRGYRIRKRANHVTLVVDTIDNKKSKKA